MISETERSSELDHLIRTAHAELGTLQICLIAAHERQLNPAELGVRIANLGRRISAWKHERRFLRQCISELSTPITALAPPAGLALETRRVDRPRRLHSRKTAPAA